MNDLEFAKKHLHDGGFTCVLCLGDSICTSTARGVKPLVAWLHDEKKFDGYSAADKVVGRGAAFLYVLLGVKKIHADIISEPALEVLDRYGIYVEYDKKAPNIINRTGDGICPFEMAVTNISDANEAYTAIIEKMKEMKIEIPAKKIYTNSTQPRVLAINDLSCFGKCSLTVAMPLLAAKNVEVVPLPTALLSTHTGGFENYHCRVLTDDMKSMIDHYKSLGIRFDALYTGYMCGTQQIDIAINAAHELLADGALVLVDPVMGDGGKLYPSFSQEYALYMRKLCSHASVITPNITEASHMADMTVAEAESDGGLDRCFERLFALGIENVVITGVRTGKMRARGNIGYAARSAKEGSEILTCEYPYVDAFLHGCGDVFASSLCAELLSGKDFFTAVKNAADFTEESIIDALKAHPEHWYGLPIEKTLERLR